MQGMIATLDRQGAVFPVTAGGTAPVRPQVP
jgi:hypothetical protein